jgi:hypothetical protein
MAINEWHEDKPKVLFHPVPSLEAGNVFREALPLVKSLEAPPLRIGSQPGGWEPIRARAVS